MLFFACTGKKDPIKIPSHSIESDTIQVVIAPAKTTHHSALEDSMRAYGLCSIQERDSSIQVQLAYADSNNFTKKILYTDMRAGFLQCEVVDQLILAQLILKKERPDLNLLVLDAARPKSVQQKMWEVVRGTDMARYVAAPVGKGSLHNLGAAVDLTLCDSLGNALDMGTPFDDFHPKAQPRYETMFYQAGELTRAHLDNRWLLRRVMKQAGFKTIQTEWWHFNAMSKHEARARFELIP